MSRKKLLENCKCTRIVLNFIFLFVYFFWLFLMGTHTFWMHFTLPIFLSVCPFLKRTQTVIMILKNLRNTRRKNSMFSLCMCMHVHDEESICWENILKFLLDGDRTNNICNVDGHSILNGTWYSLTYIGGFSL